MRNVYHIILTTMFIFCIYMSNTATTWAQGDEYIPSQYANILCYGEPTTSPYTLKYRVLEQGSTYWSTEMATNLVTQHKIRWVRVAKHPTKNERVAVFSGVDASNYVAIMVSTWSSTYGWSATTFTLVSGLPLSNNDKRCFDVVYEQNSGRAMVVYSTGSNVLAYRIYNGSNWSSQGSVGHPNSGGYILWVKLAAKPGSNEIAMIYTDTNWDSYASIWDGVSWSTHTRIGADGVSVGSSQGRMGATVEYEQLSGNAVFIYGKNNQTINARKWDGSNWSVEYSSSITVNIPREIIAKPKPGSNDILIASDEGNIELWTYLWKGSYFTPRTQHTTSLVNFSHSFDIEYENISGHSDHCILVYALQGASGIVCKHSTDGGVNWSTIANPISGSSGNIYNSVYLYRVLYSTMMWLIANEDQNKLVSFMWDINNSVWGSKDTLEDTLPYGGAADLYSAPYCMSPWAYIIEVDTTPPAAVTTLSGEPGPVPESVKLSWLTPGDDGHTGTLPSGSQYKIQYATYSNTTWDKNYAQVTISTSGVSPGTKVLYVITGLAEGVTFYFRIWTADEVPNWSDLSNIATAYAAFDLTYGSSISIPSTVMVVYSEGSNGVKYRTLTPGSTVWSDEQPVPPISSGAIYWAKIVACPVRDEKLLITLDSSGNLRVSTYSEAGGWANSAFTLRNDLTNSPATVRWFDICYEQVSGDAMVVYSTGSNVLAYRTFNGTTWSQQMSVGNLTGGADRYPYWVSISPKPNSDEILLVYSDNQDRKVYGSVWNGSSWGNHTIVYDGDVNNDSYRCSIAATYEWSSGHGVVIHANTSSQIVAKKWNGTQWLDSVSGSAGTVPQFLVLKPRPNSNEIMVFYGNSSANTFAIKWTGSSWSSYQQIDDQSGSVHAYPISGEAETAAGHEGHWISLSNQADVTGPNGGLRSDHYDGTSWTIVQKPVHNTGDLGGYKSVMTTSLPGCTTVYALVNRGNYLETLCWIPERSTWTALVQLENYLQSGSPNPYISFWMTPNSELIEIVYKVVPDSVPPAAVSDLKVSLGEVDGQDVFFATWTAPGDNGNEYKLHQPSQFRIQYSTNPDTTWDKNLAQVVIPIDIWGIDPGVKVSTMIIPSQIVEGATYYFYLWTADEVPNWSQKSNQAYVYVPKTLAYVVYYDSSTTATPKFRKIKEDGSISCERSMPSVDNPSGEGVAGFYRIAACPKRNELISVMVSADANNTTRLWTYRFNGSSWTKYSPYGSEIGPSISRGVADVAYEQDSGKALVVYARGSGSSAANVLRYVVWDGTSWSSESAATSDLGSEIYWVKLYPKPQTNEIVAVVQLQNNTIRSFVWDGNSWSDGVNLQSAASSSAQQCFDAVYESQRKKFILVCSSGTANGTVQYTIWDSTGWSSTQYFTFGTSDNPLSANPVSWIKLACKPSESNEVLMVVSDSDSSHNIGSAVWNGTSWIQNPSPLTATAGTVAPRKFDVAYEQQSGRGMIVYRDVNYQYPLYVTYTTASGWSSPTAGNSIGGYIRWLSLAADYGSNNILLVCSDFNTPTPDLSLQIWNGSSWSSNNKIETEMSERESFAVTYRKDLYAVFDKTPPAAVTDLTGEVLGEGIVKLIWSTAGDDGWSGMLPCGSRILFVFSTATPTTSELTWPATFSLIISTYGISSPQKQSYIISNLPYETTWYFKLRTRDEAGNWSELSNACTLYVVVKPAAITSLSALPSRWGRCIELSWISPGDDGWTGNIEGGLYRIRYSTYVTSDSDFWTTGTWNDFKNKFEIIWSTNTPPLQQQRRRLTGLLPGVTYYIRIWTRDENSDNWSTISNAATSWAQIVVVGIYVTGYAELSWSTTYNFDWLQTNTSSITSYGLLIRNDGNVYEDYGLKIDTITMAEVYKTEWKIDNSSVVKNNIFVLEYIFYNLPPPTTYFGTAYNSGTDDVITDTIIWSAEGTKYHPPSEVNQPENTKGIRVIPFEDNVDDLRKGWFMIRTPLATSTTEPQVIPVQFWAQENENIGPPP